VKINDFLDLYLPKDLPLLCCGYFKCIDTGSFGGECCPHSKYTHPILEAMFSKTVPVISTTAGEFQRYINVV